MSDPGFGIYLHWPYCSTICPYCDFNVHRARGADAAPLVAAIASDLAGHAARFGRRSAQSLFFGGGTPSLLSAEDIAALIEAAHRTFGLDADCEITLEANPEDAPHFAEQAAAGINRFSIGVQALDDAALHALGRHHSVADARAAIEAAARTKQRVSIDLIYAREGQSEAEWRTELREALKLPVEHISAYQLTIEEGTAFARKVARGALTPPDTDAAAALYEATQQECEAAGFTGYEISNHARGAGARARHNVIYWRGGDWLGVGPGAHGRITHGGVRLATESQRRPADYIDAVSEHGLGLVLEAPLTNSESADELLIMSVRLDEGLDVARFEALRGAPIKADALAWLVAEEFVTHADGRVRLTPRGKPLANKIAAELAF